uniref:Uncharacterized protein n=1 Tax=Taeniopygia guttata TaxID=59729 RepID=A0A674GNA4_TAEGU
MATAWRGFLGGWRTRSLQLDGRWDGHSPCTAGWRWDGHSPCTAGWRWDGHWLCTAGWTVGWAQRGWRTRSPDLDGRRDGHSPAGRGSLPPEPSMPGSGPGHGQRREGSFTPGPSRRAREISSAPTQKPQRSGHRGKRELYLVTGRDVFSPFGREKVKKHHKLGGRYIPSITNAVLLHRVTAVPGLPEPLSRPRNRERGAGGGRIKLGCQNLLLPGPGCIL